MIAAYSASFHTQVQDQERVRMTFEKFSWCGIGFLWDESSDTESQESRDNSREKKRCSRHSICFECCEYRDPTDGDREELNQQYMCGL